MKKLGWVTWLFAGIGLALIVGAGALALHTRKFVASASHAQGIVVELVRVRDSDDGSITYKPVVEFDAPNGTRISFTSSFSSNPPSHAVGDAVNVLFAPGNPDNARIDGFGSLWFVPLLLTFLGAVFATIGGAIILVNRRNEARKQWLLAHGTTILADFQGVEKNTSLKVNGRSPWRITSQWLNPATSELHVFQSENLWFDPTQYVTSKQLTVLLDPADAKRYYVDVSFLPKLAD